MQFDPTFLHPDPWTNKTPAEMEAIAIVFLFWFERSPLTFSRWASFWNLVPSLDYAWWNGFCSPREMVSGLQHDPS